MDSNEINFAESLESNLESSCLKLRQEQTYRKDPTTTLTA